MYQFFPNRAQQSILGILLLCSALANASPNRSAPLDEALSKADAVIHGVVTDVAYVLSLATDAAAPLPHTFVTYETIEVLAGKLESTMVTLRFIGGPDGQGSVFSIDGIPMFDLGDEDILLIRDNGNSTCPLVGCSQGRFRLHHDAVYSADGVAATSLKTHTVDFSGAIDTELQRVRFPSPKFDDLMQNPVARELANVAMTEQGITLEELRKDYELHAPAFVEWVSVSNMTHDGDFDTDSVAVENATPSLSKGVLLNQFRDLADRAPTLRKMSVVSADPAQPFFAALMAVQPHSTGDNRHE